MKYVAALLFLLCGYTLTVSAQRGVPESLNAFSRTSPADMAEMLQIQEDSARQIIQTLDDLVTYGERKAFTGDINLGFNGVTTRDEDDNLFNFYGGIKMDWELYPGNLDFNTMFGITYSDGELQQNVSTIDVSYDHMHINVSNGMLLENFIYLKRSTDAFLGIDQRYEIGGGVILNNWIKRLRDPGNEQLPVRYPDEESMALLQHVYEDHHGAEASEADRLHTFYNEAYIKNRMKYSKLRTALLAGLYFELEETTVRDSIDLDITNKFRWSLRPTMDIYLKDGWSLKLRTFFKMPMPWEWNEVITANDGTTYQRADYTIDFLANLSTQLMSKRIRIGFVYHLVYDNAPPAAFYTADDGSEVLVSNLDLHQSFRVSLTVALDNQ